MSWIGNLIDFVLHADKYISLIITNYGIGVYLFLFLIVFVETGLVFFPFLPGDSLIFISGTFAATGMMNYWLLLGIFIIAAILGDTLNYWIGHYFGKRVLMKSRFFNKEYLEMTEEYYAKHGGRTIILARFIPIIRTFAPFVAGIGKMHYKKFIMYNIIGAILWVPLFLTAGYFFGNIPIVADNLMLFTILIIIVSFIPPIYEVWKFKRRQRKAKKAKAKVKFENLD